MKICTRCQQELPDDAFGSHGPKQINRFCNGCYNAARRARYASTPHFAEACKLQAHQYRRAHPEHVNAKKREWARENRERMQAKSREAYRKFAGRWRAYQAVQVAIKSGALQRLPCTHCGKQPTEAHHHNGYDAEHALDVVWLCITHHKVAHRKYGD